MVKCTVKISCTAVTAMWLIPSYRNMSECHKSVHYRKDTTVHCRYLSFMWESITETTFSCHFKVFDSSSDWNLPFSYLLSAWNLLLFWHRYLITSELWIYLFFGSLLQVHSQREESYEKLQKHRQILKEDKHILLEHEREHNRLLKIGSKTDTAAEAYWESLNTGLADDGSFKRQGFLKPKFMCDNAMQAFCLQFIDDVPWPFYGSNVGPWSVLLGGAGSSDCFNRCSCMTTYFVYPFHMKHVCDS